MRAIKAVLLVPVQLVQLLLWAVWSVCKGFLRLLGVRAPVRTGQEYELFVERYLRGQGFRHIRHTGKTGDLGVDLVARKGLHTYAVQCKFYSQPVDGSAIQQVVAGKACYGCDAALVVTNATLTPGAWTLAERNRVEVLTEIDPELHLRGLSPARLLTPGRLVGFAAGCVATGATLSWLRSTGTPLGPEQYVALAAGCFLLAGLAVMGCKALWRRLWNH
ncbi:MAG: restriction endonuclease [Clostridiales bacterium]|nr:restriction endonuclease [Clostridiales bacterium]